MRKIRKIKLHVYPFTISLTQNQVVKIYDNNQEINFLST